MRSRCRNPKDYNYANYGGRGIKVCPRWESFENFLSDMGERPEGKSLDRINNDGNYEPENCRWATRGEQRRNTRGKLRVMTVGGITACFTDLAIHFKVPISKARSRLQYGWTPDEIFNQVPRMA
jgi:hypothetical protein